MDPRSVSIIFLGVTLLYAGVLSLADDLYVGAGMMIAGGVLVVMPLWREFIHSRNSSGGSTGPSVKTGRRKKKRHLKVVEREEEERPTYH
jgi:hypothetical protein